MCAGSRVPAVKPNSLITARAALLYRTEVLSSENHAHLLGLNRASVDHHGRTGKADATQFTCVNMHEGCTRGYRPPGCGAWMASVLSVITSNFTPTSDG